MGTEVEDILVKDGVSCDFTLTLGTRFKSLEARADPASFLCAVLPFLEHIIGIILLLLSVSLQV